MVRFLCGALVMSWVSLLAMALEPGRQQTAWVVLLIALVGIAAGFSIGLIMALRELNRHD